MDKSDVQEALVLLYLRLNGYFTNGFIVHAQEGKYSAIWKERLSERFRSSKVELERNLRAAGLELGALQQCLPPRFKTQIEDLCAPCPIR